MSRIELSDAERHRVIMALIHSAETFAKMARSHAYTGPAYRHTRTVMRENSRDYRALADKIMKAGNP